LAQPWYRISARAVELLSQISGTAAGIPLSSGGGVVLLDDRQFIEDYLTLLTKGPGFQILGEREEDYLKIVQLSLGPKSVFLGGQTWVDRILPGTKPGRKRKNTLVQATRKNFLLSAIKKVLKGKEHRVF